MKLTYDSNIAKIFGKTLISGPKVGIELEFEQADMGMIDTLQTTLWKFDTDHSLRAGGLEFISIPIAPHQLTEALIQAKTALHSCGGIVNKRCGVHVHLNMLDLNFRQLWQVATYYTLLEPFIFKQYADGREDSHFCVPTWANTTLQQNFYLDACRLYRGLTPKKKPSGLSPGMMATLAHVGGGLASNAPNLLAPLTILTNPKYSAMNFTCLPKFGTVEFRQARGTTSMSWVHDWTTFLLAIRSEALKFDSPDEIINEFERTGFLTLCENIGLEQSPDVNPDDLVDAIDAAIMMVGHKPTDHHTLDWEIK